MIIQLITPPCRRSCSPFFTWDKERPSCRLLRHASAALHLLRFCCDKRRLFPFLYMPCCISCMCCIFCWKALVRLEESKACRSFLQARAAQVLRSLIFLDLATTATTTSARWLDSVADCGAFELPGVFFRIALPFEAAFGPCSPTKSCLICLFLDLGFVVLLFTLIFIVICLCENVCVLL